MRIPGLGPEGRLARAVGRLTGGHLTPRGARIATFGAALVIALGIVAMLVMVQASSTPQFCGTCHIMKPYYDSWKDSSHGNIACVECHISPGITAEVRKKYEALSMVAKYLTHTYSENPWAEVEDAACLKCHERRLLEGREEFHGVAFDHRPHLVESRRGMNLRCTSCHSQMVQGTHIAVTTSTCALCHFKGQPLNEGLSTCTSCHETPEHVVTQSGVPFDHSQVAKLDMDCRGCHGGVVQGSGEVPKERCLSCHNQPARLAEFEKTDLLHRAHVTDHKVDCVNCHGLIEHGQPPPAVAEKNAAGACASCHGSGHSPQEDLYAGRGGRGVKDAPSAMFLAGVTCAGCHNPALSAEPVTTGLGVHTVRANEVACMSCHGPAYEGLYRAWKSSVASRAGALRGQLDATVGAMGVEPPPAFQDALHNWRLVERGRGVHNVSYAYALLDAAHDQMNAARRAKGLSALPRPWTVIAPNSAACLSCHLGVEKQAGTFEGAAFAHGPHLGAAKLECAACHRPHAERAPGEVVKFGRGGCVPCHHPREAAAMDGAACAKCHAGALERTLPSARGEFSHKAHLELGAECATCHTMQGGNPRPPKSACTQCHAD